MYDCAGPGLDMARVDCMLRCTSVNCREYYTCFDKSCLYAWTSLCSRLGAWTTSLISLVAFAGKHDDRMAQSPKGQYSFTGGGRWPKWHLWVSVFFFENRIGHFCKLVYWRAPSTVQGLMISCERHSKRLHASIHAQVICSYTAGPGLLYCMITRCSDIPER